MLIISIKGTEMRVIIQKAVNAVLFKLENRIWCYSTIQLFGCVDS